jgi:hypothetical protein
MNGGASGRLHREIFHLHSEPVRTIMPDVVQSTVSLTDM